MKVDFSVEELERLWEHDRYIPHDKYTRLDRELCKKLTKLLQKKYKAKE